MSLSLPPSISLYIAAANRSATEGVAECFTGDAIVRDEGNTMRGVEAIQVWMAETTRKYHHTIEPLSIRQEGAVAVVTNRLTGLFPGSPIEVQFRFVLDAGKIARLEIR